MFDLVSVEIQKKPMRDNIPFAVHPHSTPGYSPRYVALFAWQIPADVALLEAKATLEISSKGFVDFRLNRPGSAFCNVQVMLCPVLLPEMTQGSPPGDTILWGGENLSDLDNRRPYWRAVYDVDILSPQEGFWLVVYAFAASQGGKAPQKLLVPVTGPYSRMSVKCWRKRPDAPGGS